MGVGGEGQGPSRDGPGAQVRQVKTPQVFQRELWKQSPLGLGLNLIGSGHLGRRGSLGPLLWAIGGEDSNCQTLVQGPGPLLPEMRGREQGSERLK